MVKANNIKGAVASLSLGAMLISMASVAQAGGAPGYAVTQPSATLPFLRQVFNQSAPADSMVDDKMMDDMRTSPWDYFGSVDLSTNYVFRGRTQTDDKLAFSVEVGGSYDIGKGRFYGKVWAGNVDIPEIQTRAQAGSQGETCDAGAENGLITLSGCQDADGNSLRGNPVLTGKNTDYELDFTIGYGAEFDNLALHTVRYDIGYIAYTFPNAKPSQELDESHIFLTVGYENLSLTGIVLADSDANADFGDRVYYSADYEMPLPDGWGLELHYGIEDIVGDADLNQDFSATVTKLGFHLGVLATTGFSGNITTDDQIRAADRDRQPGQPVGASYYNNSDKQFYNNKADEDVRVVFGYTYSF
ncbi:MAG: hypothetical protein HAW64_01330 [Alphaproteobacteria bacterium]|nr:hypothetical protein [Alphaproteobacteria bacterium]